MAIKQRQVDAYVQHRSPCLCLITISDSSTVSHGYNMMLIITNGHDAWGCHFQFDIKHKTCIFWLLLRIINCSFGFLIWRLTGKSTLNGSENTLLCKQGKAKIIISMSTHEEFKWLRLELLIPTLTKPFFRQHRFADNFHFSFYFHKNLFLCRGFKIYKLIIFITKLTFENFLETENPPFASQLLTVKNKLGQLVISN